MTHHEALIAAADFIGSDGGSLDDGKADLIANALREIAADYFADLTLRAFMDVLDRGGFRLTFGVVEPNRKGVR